MKKIGILIFAAAVIVGVCVASSLSFGRVNSKFFGLSSFNKKTKGSGHVSTEARDITGFSGVDVSGVFQVDITSQKDFAVEVEADDNLLPLIKTEVRDGMLHIETERRISTNNGLKIRISAPDISKINASGVARVNLVNVNNNELRSYTSGAAKTTVSGVTAKLLAEVNGASSLDAESLRAEAAEVDASGASSASIFATDELSSDASGASKIVYSGSPANIKKNSSGASTIKEK